MKKRLKIFAKGKYPQGDFDEGRISKIFEKAKDGAKAIFQHTSKWKEKGKQAVEIGSWENFEIKSGEVFADIDFNEKGKSYYDDGILSGVSIEITKDDTLGNIAVLPVGVQQQIPGAEFQEESELVYYEFEEQKEEKMTIQEIIEFLKKAKQEDKKAVLSTVTDGMKKADLAKEFGLEVKKTEPAETQEQMEARIRKEYEKKAKLSEFSKEISKKVLPKHKAIVEFAYAKALEEDKIIEFSEKEKITMQEKIEKTFEGTGENDFLNEFGRTDGNPREEKDVMEESRKETERVYGGDK